MVKIIVTGATGFVGNEALRYYITRSDITSVIVLTRRDIPSKLKKNGKVTVILRENFTSYSSELLKQLDGAVACIWTLGLKGAPLGYSDPALAEKVDVTYPLAAATAFANHFTTQPFRFVLCNGIGAEMDEAKGAKLWMMRDTCLLKGRIERALHDLAQGKPEFEVYTCRPFGILEEKPSMVKWLLFTYLMSSVKAVELAATMLELGLKGDEKWIWENGDIKIRGGEILRAQG